MNDEELVELLASHDPVLGDPPPKEGSPRFNTNLEKAMNPNAASTQTESPQALPLNSRTAERHRPPSSKKYVVSAMAAAAVVAIVVAGLNVSRLTNPDEVVNAGPADSSPEESVPRSGSVVVPEGEITSLVITSSKEVRQYPGDTISDQSTMLILDGGNHEVLIDGQSLSIQLGEAIYTWQEDGTKRFVRSEGSQQFPTVNRSSLSAVSLRDLLSEMPGFDSRTIGDDQETFTVTVDREEYLTVLRAGAESERELLLFVGILVEDNSGGDLGAQELPNEIQLTVTASGDVVTEIVVVVQGTNAAGPVDMTLTTTFDRFNDAPDIVAPTAEQTDEIVDPPSS